MTPSVNVNLAYNPRDPLADEARVLIPCRLPPSVTFTVALGECIFPCTASSQYDLLGSLGVHHKDCPARPVRVSCSVLGGTWRDSELGEFDLEPSGISPNDALRDACRARWALVKALVLGASKVSEFPEPFRMVPAVSEMLVQRDAVYAALADMVRAEDAAFRAQDSVAAHLAGRVVYRGAVHKSRREDRPSSDLLATYVEHLVKQVWVLS